MVTETDTTIPAAAQQLAPSDPLAVAIEKHRSADATYIAAFERSCRLIEAVDPDLDFEDLEDVRAKLTAHYGAAAPAEFDVLMAAREASRLAGEAEDDARRKIEAVPLSSAARVAAYAAYVKAQASTQDGSESLPWWRALDRLAVLLSERLAA